MVNILRCCHFKKKKKAFPYVLYVIYETIITDKVFCCSKEEQR